MPGPTAPVGDGDEYELRVREQSDIVGWRYGVLRRGGFGPEIAVRWAELPSHELDVRQAVALLAAGCPLSTALRILRPFSDP